MRVLSVLYINTHSILCMDIHTVYMLVRASRRRVDPQASSNTTNSSADAAHRRAAGDDQGANVPLFSPDSPPTPPGFLKDEVSTIE